MRFPDLMQPNHPFTTFCVILFKIMKIIHSLILTALMVEGNLMAENWSAFRGSDGTAVSHETHLPVEWGKDDHVVWKVNLPGKGTSSPIIHQGRVFVTTQVDDKDLHVIAFGLKSGELIWNQKVGSGRLPTHELHNMSTPTPITDGHHVWAFFGTGDLVCLTFEEGSEVWRRNLRTEYANYNTNHGMGNSPLLYDGKLYVACMHQGPSYLIAMDATSGKTLWKKDRNLSAREEGNDSYSTPVKVNVEGDAQIVLSGAEHLNAYNPDTGEEIWSIGGLEVPHPYGRTISGPTAGEGKVVTVASGFRNQGYVIGVTPVAEGKAPKLTQDWTQRRYAPDCPTPLIYKGKVYTIRDDGMASCLDLASGESHWQERLFAENVKVSPVAADGHVYFTTGRANTKVVKASTEFEVVAENRLDDETLASPAISEGNIVIRTFEHLYCIR